MTRQRIRIRFSKSGTLRYIGHRDLMRLIERLFRRAGVAPAMSEGFHPKPRMSFPLALAVGIEGRDEIFEPEIRGFLQNGTLCPFVGSFAEEFVRRTGREPLRGLVFHEATDLSPEVRKASVLSATYQISVPESRSVLADLQVRLAEILAMSSYPMTRPNRSSVDLRQSLQSAQLRETVLRDGGPSGPVLEMRFAVTPGADAGPRELLTALGVGDLEQRGFVLVRTSLELDPATDERRGDVYTRST